ncbi:hypothetical protein BDR04DRAFT_1093872, partial [Suillus decipiens]
MLMFEDEAAKNKHTLARHMGRSARGIHCVQSRPFVRGTRFFLSISLIPMILYIGSV